MTEELGYDNDPSRREHNDEEVLRWQREMYLEYLEEERHLKDLRHRDEDDEDAVGHGQSEVEGFEEETDVEHHDEAFDHHIEDHVEVLDEETTVDHLEQFDVGDGAVASYAAATFRPWQRKVRNRIDGEDWAPPYKKELFIPIFVGLEPPQLEADPGYDDWIPYDEEAPPMP